MENELKLSRENKDDKNLQENLTSKEMADPVTQNSIFSNGNTISISVLLIAVIVVSLTFVKECRECYTTLNKLESAQPNQALRKYWVYGRNVESGYLSNVFEVLDRLGYKNDPNASNWDLLWAHDYPFRALQARLVNLKPHQKVNKFPGSGYITNKVDLATSGLKYIPSAFRLPKQKDKLLKYAEIHPNVQFVQKSNDHRNIYIKKINEIDLNVEGTFIQEFVDKPFLVSGYKFDIGVYTVITSVDPLRIYIYNEEALLRFCPVRYYPFNSSNIDKYVVGDDYLPTWDVPALTYFYKTLGFNMKESLNAHVESIRRDPSVIWEQIEDSIRTVVLAKEQAIVEIVNRYSRKHNFFELMRFDFVLTEDLKVYLMEANMSPNLSSAHFPPNKLLFEQVIFNLFGLVGIADRVQKAGHTGGGGLTRQLIIKALE